MYNPENIFQRVFETTVLGAASQYDYRLLTKLVIYNANLLLICEESQRRYPLAVQTNVFQIPTIDNWAADAWLYWKWRN